MAVSNGEKMSWHVLFDGQHLKHTKDGWVHIEEPTGNVAKVIHPGYVTQGGSVKKGEDGNVRELCAVCRLDTGRNEFGMFDSDGYCQNCGAARNGNGIRVLNFDPDAIEDIPSFHDKNTFEDDNGIQKSICGADGLPRKVYIRDVVLSDAEIFEGTHYSKLEYRAIKDWEEEGLNKPEDFDEKEKYKYLQLTNFNSEKSPLSIEEIQELIDCSNIIVVEG